MIEPDQFYQGSDKPSTSVRRRIWRSVEARISPHHSSWVVLERRSFLLGMAASVVVLLAGIGAVSAVQRAMDNARPSSVRVDHAYESAIREFEDLTVRTSAADLVPTATPAFVSRNEVMQSRREALQSLDRGIESIQSELRSGDLSPLKRSRLRDLYAKKLVILLDMIEQGEITL